MTAASKIILGDPNVNGILIDETIKVLIQRITGTNDDILIW